ncbi:MAG: hypothetical protein OEW24_00465 [Chloroflexota bacterium]|nr:hypothetical protein [Chloroflexota bacterium]
MTRPATSSAAVESRTVVWIDSRRALLVRWDGTPHVTRLESEVPPRRRGGEHVTHDAILRTMGAPDPDGHRSEHLRQFLQQVAACIDPRDPVEIVGRGPVHKRLADLVVEQDGRHGRAREVTARPAKALTEAQLIARVREIAGDSAPRVRRGVPASR